MSTMVHLALPVYACFVLRAGAGRKSTANWNQLARMCHALLEILLISGDGIGSHNKIEDLEIIKREDLLLTKDKRIKEEYW